MRGGVAFTIGEWRKEEGKDDEEGKRGVRVATSVSHSFSFVMLLARAPYSLLSRFPSQPVKWF
jgi:hypothetical protein